MEKELERERSTIIIRGHLTMIPDTYKHHIFDPPEQKPLEVDMFYAPKGASVRLHHYKVDSTLTGFTNVKPVNLRSQVNEQLRHSSVKFVILPAS